MLERTKRALALAVLVVGGYPPAATSQEPSSPPGPEDVLRLSPAQLRALRFKDGLAEVLVDGRAYYVSRSGKSARVHLFENGADYFSEGLARTISRGKYGFIDRRLTVVIEPAYDFAFPFKGNRAVVCVECAPVTEGEYRAIRGGRWGMIDRTGAVVTPLSHSREELERLRAHSPKKR
jgi:hypothetical protein